MTLRVGIVGAGNIFQRGYLLGDTVLRPAMVYVSSGAPEAPCAAEDAAGEFDVTSD